MDTYIVDIDIGEWWIYKEGFDFKKQDDYKSFDNYLFGGSGLKDDKIIYIFDIGISDDDIKIYKDDKIFLEKVNFKVLKENKELKSFQGNFIDALNYIKKVF